jgi:hypothetical protein
MSARLCKFCESPIEWVYVRFGNSKPHEYRWAAVSVTPDPEGRVVFWNDEWIYLRKSRAIKVDPQLCRRLHGPRQCVLRDQEKATG